MVLRNLHSTITEEYGLPSWMSYVLFALATIVVGALLGLVRVILYIYLVCHGLRLTWRYDYF